jgi:hypothetical protein
MYMQMQHPIRPQLSLIIQIESRCIDGSGCEWLSAGSLPESGRIGQWPYPRVCTYIHRPIQYLRTLWVARRTHSSARSKLTSDPMYYYNSHTHIPWRSE